MLADLARQIPEDDNYMADDVTASASRHGDRHDGHIHPLDHFCGSNCPMYSGLGREVGEPGAPGADRIPATSRPENAATTLVIEGPDAYRRVTLPEGVETVEVYVGVDGVSVRFDGEEVEDANE